MIELEAQITIKRAGENIDLTVGAVAVPFSQSLEVEADGGVEDIEYILDNLGQPWYGELTPDERNYAFEVLRDYLEDVEPNLQWDGA